MSYQVPLYLLKHHVPFTRPRPRALYSTLLRSPEYKLQFKVQHFSSAQVTTQTGDSRGHTPSQRHGSNMRGGTW